MYLLLNASGQLCFRPFFILYADQAFLPSKLRKGCTRIVFSLSQYPFSSSNGLMVRLLSLSSWWLPSLSRLPHYTDRLQSDQKRSCIKRKNSDHVQNPSFSHYIGCQLGNEYRTKCPRFILIMLARAPD